MEKTPPSVTHYSPNEVSNPTLPTGGRSNFSGSGIIGSAISTIGGLIDNAFNRRAERKAREAQIAENEKNREWTEKMWEEHESPQAQVQDMKAVGLNPAGNVSSQSVGSASTSSLPTPGPSTVGASIAQGADFYLRSRQLEASLKKTEAETQAIDNSNKLFMATYDDAVAMTNALLKEKQISNDTASYMQKLIRDAYFNEDGTIKDNPNTLDLKNKKLQNTILGVEANRLEYEKNISELFGIQYHTLPDDIKWGIDKAFLLNLMDPVGYPIAHTQAQLAEEIDNARVQIKQKRSKDAYTFLHILDELEVGFDKLLGYLNRLSPEIKSQFLGSVLDIM